jgi:hypothetical protein
MPIFLRVSPAEVGKPTIRGQDALNRFLKKQPQIPFPDASLESIREQARLLSSRSTKQKIWEVIWVCWKGGKSPTATVVYVFEDGKRLFPKGKVGERTHKRLADLKTCMLRATSVCNRGYDPEKVTAKQAIKGRRRKVFVECPVEIKPLTKTKPKKKTPAPPQQEVAAIETDE